MDLIADLARTTAATAIDVLPVVLLMLFFHRVVLGQKLANAGAVLIGFGLVIAGLSMLLLGLDNALFPVGRLMVEQLTGAAAAEGTLAPAHWSSYYAVYAFAFCIAFGTAAAEPALLAISLRVNEISGGAIRAGGLRVAAALGVAAGVTLGCIRIAAGVPLLWCVAAVFAAIAVQTLLAPRTIVPLAYDVGGVSTTAVTVPVVTALGLGFAEQLPGRNPLLDGFGLIALACLFPAITVLAYAQASWVIDRLQSRRDAAAKPKTPTRKEE